MKRNFKKKSLVLLLFVAFLTTSCAHSNSNGTSTTTKAESKTTEESGEKQTKIKLDKAFIVDVRTPAEFASGHFDNAINIPLDELESALKQFEGHEQIIVYCRSGSRSGRAKEILESHGFTDVINGINESHLRELK